ncbi:MAG: hypothetical protein HWN68_19650 [Desulfobacterales bacterium]|nr:hypothetical protein [Desulfobacterales bacterium]
MLEWIKKHGSVVITVVVTICLLIWLYGCEPKVRSLNDSERRVTRQELQLELNQLIGLAELRMLDLDRQERLRAIILQNALILVQGQPFNPVGLITAVAAVYGVSQAGGNVSKVVKVAREKRKVKNGTA